MAPKRAHLEPPQNLESCKEWVLEKAPGGILKDATFCEAFDVRTYKSWTLARCRQSWQTGCNNLVARTKKAEEFVSLVQSHWQVCVSYHPSRSVNEIWNIYWCRTLAEPVMKALFEWPQPNVKDGFTTRKIG
jgi:hypothetical protein